MKFTKLGATGLEVSRICLGGMSFGDASRGGHSWALPEDQARPLIRQAVEAGINFFDTANVYNFGSSEEILGRALKDYGIREDLVIATKVMGTMRPGPNGGGLSRKAIKQEVDASLRRLGVDYVDLLQIHRWVDDTPIEETMEALDDIVRAGKALYLGASSMFAWQFARAQWAADKANGASFISMQDHYNLLYREEEREMFGLCADLGVGVICWSPLARGRLVRDWATTSVRSENDAFGATLYSDEDEEIVKRVATVASARDLPRSHVALAWVLKNPVVTSAIVGATKEYHIREAVEALDVELTEAEMQFLEEPYRPRPVVGM